MIKYTIIHPSVQLHHTLEWDYNSNMLQFTTPSAPPPPFSTQTDPLVCSNTEDTPPLSIIEPVIYNGVVKKNDTKMTVKISTFVDKEDLTI